MIFEPSDEFTQNFFMRWVSTEKKWEIGFTRMLFGVRVRFGRYNGMTCDLDYCAGNDVAFQIELLRTIKIILLAVPEDVSQREISDMFPRYQTKPINLDPCWKVLLQMADQTMDQLKDSAA